MARVLNVSVSGASGGRVPGRPNAAQGGDGEMARNEQHVSASVHHVYVAFPHAAAGSVVVNKSHAHAQ